jgi:hypothetical protein
MEHKDMLSLWLQFFLGFEPCSFVDRIDTRIYDVTSRKTEAQISLSIACSEGPADEPDKFNPSLYIPII